MPDLYDQFFAQQGGQMFSGREPLFTGPFNMGGQSALLMQMMQPMLQQMMGQHGMVPFQFMPMQGLHDQQRATSYQRNQMEAMRLASKRDQETYVNVFRGMATSFGTPFGLRQQAAANTMANDIAGLAPLLAQIAPETFDRMHGSRGSAVLLSQVLHRSRQHTVDPLTGGIGISGRSAGVLADEVFSQYYSRGNLAQMRGIGAGEMGLAYEQLMQRGLGSPSIGRLSATDQARAVGGQSFTNEQFARMAERSGRSEQEIRREHGALRIAGQGTIDPRRLDTPAAQEMLRTFDASKVGNRMKEMAGAVAAMRDIFGDMGHANAPMAELIAGLEALTQNSMANMTPSRMERLVRQTHSLAQSAGMSMEAAMALMGHTGQQADRMGLDRSLASQATMGAIAFGGAIADTGRLDIPAFGSLDRTKMTMLDAQLRMNAAGSPLVNRAAALMRMRDRGMLNPNSGAAALANALAGGQTQASFGGKTLDMAMNESDMVDLMTQGGLSQGAAYNAIRATHANQEQIGQYGLANLGRSVQVRTDIAPIFSQTFADAINMELRGTGMDDNDRLAASREVGKLVGGAALQMDEGTFRDTAKRQAFLEEKIKAGLTAQLGPGAVAALGPDAIRRMAETGYTGADQFFNQSPQWRGYGGAMGVMQMHAGNTPAQTAARMAAARTDAEMASSMAGLGRASPVQRAIDTIMDAKSSDSLFDVAGKLAGGVDVGKLDRNDIVLRSFLEQQGSFHGAERHTSGPMKGQLTSAGLLQQETAAQRTRALLEGGSLATGELAKIAQSIGLTAGDIDKLDINDWSTMRAKYKNPKELAYMQHLVTGLRAARGEGGLGQRLTDAGHLIGASVSQADIGKAHTRGLMAAELFGAAPADRDAWRQTQAYQTALQRTDASLDTTRSTLDAIMGDEKTMAQLGGGGLGVMQGIEGNERSLRELSKASGYSVQQLLMGDVDPKDQGLVAQARRHHAGITTGWAAVAKRQVGRPKSPWTADEKSQWESLRQFRTAYGPNPAAAARAQAEAVADAMLGTAAPSDRARMVGERERLVGSLMEGDRQLPIKQGLLARDSLLEMAKKYNLIDDKSSPAQQQAAVERLMQGKVNIDAADQADLARNKRMIGAMSALGGTGADTMDEQIQLTERYAKAANQAAALGSKETAMKLVGTLNIVGLKKAILEGQALSMNTNSSFRVSPDNSFDLPRAPNTTQVA